MLNDKHINPYVSNQITQFKKKKKAELPAIAIDFPSHFVFSIASEKVSTYTRPNIRYTHLKMFTLGRLFKENSAPLQEIKNIKIGLWVDKCKLWD